MDLDLTETQEQLRETCRAFADRELKPHARHWDETHHFPAEAVAKLRELGLLSVAIPEAWGGAGMDNVSYALAVEEISRGCASTGVIMSVNNSLYCDPVYKFGTDAQRGAWLKEFAHGDKLGCFALTEPEAGSDAAAQKTLAVRQGDFYVLNGSKNFITNGPNASAALVFAMTDKPKGHHGISAFLVPTDGKGFSRGASDRKLGITASQSCSMFFEDCRVPVSNRLGGEGDGFKIAMSTLDGGRIGIAAQAVGIARGAFEEAVAYAKERKSFDVPIAEHQAIQFMLADMATEIEAAHLLVLRAASLKDQDARYSAEASMAKLYASEMANRVTNKALQIHGGYGYLKDFDAERHLRDARITEIYEGTSEIQRLVISHGLLKD